jgi:MFS family permease
MMIMMVITPLAVHSQSHSTMDSLSVIGWHIIGMFLPSLVTGKLIDRFGSSNVAIVGVLVFAASSGVAIAGMSLNHYYISLFLLGIGWNLLYVAGTSQYNNAYEKPEQGKAQGMAELLVAVVGIIAVVSGWLLLQFMIGSRQTKC